MAFGDQIDISGFGRPVRSFTQGLQGGLQLGLSAIQTGAVLKQQKIDLAFKSLEAQSKMLDSVKSLTDQDRANLMTNMSQTLKSIGAISEAKTYTAEDMKSTAVADFNKRLKQLNSDNKVGSIPNQDYISGLIDLMETTATMTDEDKAIAENSADIVRKSREKQREIMNKKKPQEERIDVSNVKAWLRSKGMSEEMIERIEREQPNRLRIPNSKLGIFGFSAQNKIQQLSNLTKQLEFKIIDSPERQAIQDQIDDLRFLFEGTAQIPALPTEQIPGGLPGATPIITPEVTPGITPGITPRTTPPISAPGPTLPKRPTPPRQPTPGGGAFNADDFIESFR